MNWIDKLDGSGTSLPDALYEDIAAWCDKVGLSLNESAELDGILTEHLATRKTNES